MPEVRPPQAEGLRHRRAMAEDKDRDRSRDHRGRDLAPSSAQRSARPPTATSADIERVLGAIGGLSEQIQAIGVRTAATELRIEEMAADIGDMREVQEATAHTVASLCSRTEKIETALAEAPPFDDIAARLRALETRPLPSAPPWRRPSQTSTPSGPTTPPSGGRTPPQRNPYEADPTIIRLVADKPVPRDAVTKRVEELLGEANLIDRKVQVRGAYLGQRHLLRITGKNETEDAKALVQSLRLPDGTWMTPLIHSPEGSSVGIHLYPDRPQAERARRGEAMRVLRIIQAEGVADAVAHGRNGLVAKGWTPLAKVDYDVATGATRTTLHVEALRAAGGEPGIIQRHVDDSEDRPRPGDPQDHDPQATPVEPNPAPTRRSASASRTTPTTPFQTAQAQQAKPMDDSTMAQPVL